MVKCGRNEGVMYDVLGGVSGGLAEYSGIDALLWRVGFVALTLAGGAGVIVYLLLWLLIPAD